MIESKEWLFNSAVKSDTVLYFVVTGMLHFWMLTTFANKFSKFKSVSEFFLPSVSYMFLV